MSGIRSSGMSLVMHQLAFSMWKKLVAEAD